MTGPKDTAPRRRAATTGPLRRDLHRRLACGVLQAVLACGVLLAVLACGGGTDAPGRLVPGALPFEPRSEVLGAFTLHLEGSGWTDARLRLVHGDRPGRTAFETRPGEAFLEVARGRAEPGPDGVTDEVQERCADLSLDGLEAELYVLRLSGRFRCAVLDRAFELFLVPEGESELRVHLRLADPSFNRIALVRAVGADERLHGLGARGALDPSGRRLAVWVSATPPPAPGLLGRLLGRTPRDAGSRAPVPHLLSSAGWGLLLENAGYARFDLRARGRARVEVHAHELTFRLHAGAGLPELVEQATAAAGRAPALPAWALEGPVVRVTGGAPAVRDAVARLAEAGVAPAAVQIDDWASGPATAAPAPDATRYPEPGALVAALEARGVRVLVPVAPRLPVDGEGALPEAFAVRDLEGAPVAEQGLGWIDLSNPDARSWWVDALHSRVLAHGVAGLALGPASPPDDARLAGDVPAHEWHNRWPDAAARVARRAFREAERPREGLVLAETGFVRSPRHGVVLLGGEAADPTAWARLLSGGLSGFAYGAVDVDAAAPPEARARALGAAAFAPLFRVRAADFTTPEDLAALAGATRLHAAWRGFRGELARRAVERGEPLLRPIAFHHPGHAPAWAAGGRAFLVGDQLLVAPAFDPLALDSPRIEVDLPPGRWIDAYTGTVHGLPERGVRVTLEAPGGRAALLHAEGSVVGRDLRARLAVGAD